MAWRAKRTANTYFMGIFQPKSKEKVKVRVTYIYPHPIKPLVGAAGLEPASLAAEDFKSFYAQDVLDRLANY